MHAMQEPIGSGRSKQKILRGLRDRKKEETTKKDQTGNVS
jgi:hypothetical protein